VAATGYRPALEPLVGRLGVLDDRGEPVVHGAEEHPRAPGLHFVGYRVTLGGTFRHVALQAKQLARAVAVGVVAVATSAGTAVGANERPWPLSVVSAATPRLPVARFATDGTYPQVREGTDALRAVNSALDDAIVSDQFPRARALLPLQLGADGWLGITVRVPSGTRVRLEDLFARRAQAVHVLAAALRNDKLLAGSVRRLRPYLRRLGNTLAAGARWPDYRAGRGDWDGRYDRPFEFTHHAICHDGKRRI